MILPFVEELDLMLFHRVEFANSCRLFGQSYKNQNILRRKPTKESFNCLSMFYCFV